MKILHFRSPKPSVPSPSRGRKECKRPFQVESYNNRFASRTSSADLVYSIGFSIGMHVLILLTDPLSSLNFADRLKEQLNGVIIVNLMEGTGEPSNPGAAKSVPPVKEEIKKKERAEKNSLPSLRSKA